MLENPLPMAPSSGVLTESSSVENGASPTMKDGEKPVKEKEIEFNIPVSSLKPKSGRKLLAAQPLKEEIGAEYYEDSDSSEDEGMQDYKVGGYHTVHVGEVYNGRYVII